MKLILESGEPQNNSQNSKRKVGKVFCFVS